VHQQLHVLRRIDMHKRHLPVAKFVAFCALLGLAAGCQQQDPPDPKTPDTFNPYNNCIPKARLVREAVYAAAAASACRGPASKAPIAED